MKKGNVSLWIGGLVILLLILVVSFPGLFSKANPYGIESIRSWVTEDGSFHLEKSPFKPDPSIPMGTDAIGRDILSLIVHGSRLTLFLALMIALMRFLVAIPVGISAGFGSIVAKSIINQFAVIFSAIPALLISILILNMDYFVQLEKWQSILAFTLVLTAVGWGKLGLLISERVEMILKEPFVAGDYAIGKGQGQIALTTVLPHLLPELVVLFFLEFARALSIIMQLGIFGVFVGNVRIIEDTDMGTTKYMNISYEPEWASMLGTARLNIRSAPWTVWYPAMAFFISVLGLNLFGEGLRRMLKEQQHVFRNMRRLLKNNARKPLVVLAIVLVLSTGVLFGQMGKTLTFDSQSQYPETLMLDNGPVVIGTENAEKTARYIEDAFKQMGLNPLKSETFIHPYSTQKVYYPHSSSVAIESYGTLESLQEGRDYAMFSYGDYALTTDVLDYRRQDLYNLGRTTEKEPVDGRFVLLDADHYTDEAIRYFSEVLIQEKGAKGVVWTADIQNRRLQQIGDLSFDGPALFINKSLVDKISGEGAQLQIEMESRETAGQGHNIIAYRPGNDPKVKDEALVFGFAYNALEQELAKNKIAFAFEMINQLLSQRQNDGRTLIFVFFDGTLHEEFLGQKAYVEVIPYEQKKQMLFIDLTRIEGHREGYVLYSAKQSPISRYFAYSFSRQMVDRLKQENIEPRTLEPLWPSDAVLFLEQGTPTLIFGMTQEVGSNPTSCDALGRFILETITFNNY